MFRAFCVAYAMEGSTFLEAGNISLSKTFPPFFLLWKLYFESSLPFWLLNFVDKQRV